jgi:hypothetical protein
MPPVEAPVVIPFVPRDSHQKLLTLVDRRVRKLDADRGHRRLRHVPLNSWTLDRLLRRHGLDIAALISFSHPVLQVVIADGVWTLNAARIRSRRVYWTDNRGFHRLAAVAEDTVRSADRDVARRVVGENGIYDPQWIIASDAPSRIISWIDPHRFLSGGVGRA